MQYFGGAKPVIVLHRPLQHRLPERHVVAQSVAVQQNVVKVAAVVTYLKILAQLSHQILIL